MTIVVTIHLKESKENINSKENSLFHMICTFTSAAGPNVLGIGKFRSIISNATEVCDECSIHSQNKNIHENAMNC
jgi:hypothetical protein